MRPDVIPFFTIATTSSVPGAKRYQIEKLSADFTRVILHYGYMESPRLPAALVGSAMDVLGLSTRMTNVASRWLAAGDNSRSRAYGLRLPRLSEGARLPNELEYSWAPDRVLRECRRNYQIRLSTSAEATLLGWIGRSERLNGPEFETGGAVFGQIDEFLKVIWVSEVGGPPPDSAASPGGFICGTKGVAEMNGEKTARSRSSVTFIGMRHRARCPRRFWQLHSLIADPCSGPGIPVRAEILRLWQRSTLPFLSISGDGVIF